MTSVTVAEVADELYGLAPAEFVAARDEQARAARAGGQRDEAAAIRKLARPTASAWLVNQLSRQVPDQVRRLAAVAEALADAQRSLAGDRLRELSAERRQVIADLVPAAEAIARQAGQPASANVLGEVRATLEAAVADAGAREAVRSGRLTRALNYAGLGEVDLTEALALPDQSGGHGDGRALREPAQRDRTRGDTAIPEAALREAAVHDAALHEAEATAADLDRALAEADQHQHAVEEQRQFLRRRIEQLEDELTQTRTQASQLTKDAQRAGRAREVAARRAERASRDLAKARQKASRSRCGD